MALTSVGVALNRPLRPIARLLAVPGQFLSKHIFDRCSKQNEILQAPVLQLQQPRLFSDSAIQHIVLKSSSPCGLFGRTNNRQSLTIARNLGCASYKYKSKAKRRSKKKSRKSHKKSRKSRKRKSKKSKSKKCKKPKCKKLKFKCLKSKRGKKSKKGKKKSKKSKKSKKYSTARQFKNLKHMSRRQKLRLTCRPKFKSVFSEKCCPPPCPEVPSYDCLFYRVSDKCRRHYQRTWIECPNKRRKRITCFPNLKKLKLPPVEKRKKKPKTAKSFSKCGPKAKGSCKRIRLPGCKNVRYPPTCNRSRRKSKCKKEKSPFPAYSECQKPCIKGPRPRECSCLDLLPLCLVYQYLRSYRRHGSY